MSAGAYLQMNGFETEIFELNSTPGGVCTSWKRGDYTVDWCVHWLVGSGASDSFYERWSELIDMQELEIVDHEEYAVVEDVQGNRLHIYTDLDRLEHEMLTKAPEDEAQIKEFIAACRHLVHLDMPNEQAMQVANFWYKIKAVWKMLPYLGDFGKYSRISTADYANKFGNPLLHKAIYSLFEPEFPILFCMMTLAWMHKKAAGYPIGGSLNFARRIADRFEELGGKFQFDSRVSKILVENGKAAGIELANGETHSGDYVISAADAHSTIFDMLGSKFTHPKLEEFFANRQTFPSLVFVALGVGRTFHAAPHSYLISLEKPLEIDPETNLNDLYLRIHNFDPTLAPAGKTLVSCLMETRNWEYWTDLHRNNPQVYREEKQRIIDAIVDILEKKLGNVRFFVEMTDVTTPATIISFTNNWKGSFEGWLLTTETGFKQLPNTLQDLENFFLCGQWVAVGGGLPTAMMSGRDVAQMICRQEGKHFEIVAPEHREALVGEEV